MDDPVNTFFSVSTACLIKELKASNLMKCMFKTSCLFLEMLLRKNLNQIGKYQNFARAIQKI